MVFSDKCPQQCILELTRVYGDQTMRKTAIYKWHRRFREGQKDTKDDRRPGRPCEITAAKCEKVSKLIEY